jgi:hypothetical protein
MRLTDASVEFQVAYRWATGLGQYTEITSVQH